MARNVSPRLAAILFADNLHHAARTVHSAKSSKNIHSARWLMSVAIGYCRQALQRANATGDAGRKALAFAMLNKVRAQARMIGV